MFKKFPSIESLAHVVRGQEFYDKPATVSYGAKVKLHGTNAAVACTDDGYVFAQSRSRIITPSDDNMQFAAWVRDTSEAWSEAFSAGPAGHVVVYGEWAGKGIMKGDAVTQLDDKYFFVFAVQIDDDIVVEPHEIEQMVPDLDNLLVLPWDTIWDTPFNLGDEDELQFLGGEVGRLRTSVGERDPFIHGVFGIDGPGEGIVVVPRAIGEDDPNEAFSIDRHWYSSLMFKVKTEAHAVKKNQGAKVKLEVPQNVLDFAEMFVTPARCEQGYQAIGGPATKQMVGQFIKWMGQDIKKESVAELEEAGLKWKDVSSAVTNAVKLWWFEKCEEL